MRVALGIVIGMSSFAASTAAADVTWQAPAGCPTQTDVRHRIERRIGDQSLADLEISITVTRTAGTLTASIDTGALSGHERTLTSTKCDQLADAVALIVARLAGEAGREPTRSVLPAPAPRVDAFALALPSSPAVEREAARPVAWTGGVRALALSGIGMTPEVGVGADVSAFAQRERAFVEVGYAKWAPRPMQILPSVEGAVDFDIQLVAVRGGWASTRMPLRGWAGVEVGRMHGEGPALRTPASGVGRWIAISSGFGVGWPISPRTRLVGTFEVAVPVERARFQFMDGSEVREPAPISARSALGVELAWR